MSLREPQRTGWAYYAAIVLFVAILAFAVLGLVRSSSLAGASTEHVGDATRVRAVTPRGPEASLSARPVATPQIPPPTPSAPTEPPSRTYIHPPPGPSARAVPQPVPQPRQ